MRALQTHDLFIAMKILNSAGVKEEFQKMANQVASGKAKNQQQIGIDFILNVIGACGNDKTEALVYEFLGGLLEMEPATIKVMDPLNLIENIKALGEVIPVEQWKSFFQSVLRGTMN